MISFEDKELHYGKKLVLSKLTLKINKGDKVAILGESGVGKTTLLKAMREEVNGTSSWCPQDPGLVPMLNGYHNIYMGRLDQHHFLKNLKELIFLGQQEKDTIKSIAKSVALENELTQVSGAMSGGQRQRLSIGRALYSQKSILLADEPVSALDEFQAQEVLTLVANHFETMVLVLHDIELALKFCDRVIALKNDTVFFDKSSASLTEKDLQQIYQ